MSTARNHVADPPGTAANASRPGVEAVDRALAVLHAVAAGDGPATLAAIAAQTGLYKSTILRLMGSLERGELIRRTVDGRYRLDIGAYRLGLGYQRQFDLGGLVRPVLVRLVQATGETASYYVRDGDARVCLFRLNSPRPVRHHLDEGTRLPLDRGAAGRVLLAFSGAGGEAAAAIRAAGHHISLGERDPEIAAASVPVFDAGGRLCGALAISGLLSRFDAAARAAALRELRSAAHALSGLPVGRPGAADGAELR